MSVVGFACILSLPVQQNCMIQLSSGPKIALMTISPDFLDELRARLPLSDIVGKRVRLRRAGREHVGLCPFHKEKTPSFTVSDDKAFYHCFGCGAHGDVIRFVMETEGASFPEVVERLAGLAGLTVPQARPQDRARDAQRRDLLDVVEAAARWFAAQLTANVGQGARDYLNRRGVSQDAIAGFRIGFAPNRRDALKNAMLARDIGEAQLIEAGLLIQPEDGGESFDRFRNRIIFPIGDAGGRVVAFGGRALGEARAKYLNSPETPLFSKGRLLYNFHHARAVRDGPVIVAEGYMDVIALADAGLERAVAPLGTALSEAQLARLWRLDPEPVLCFDGDKAGQAAAWRALERALPLLAPGQSLRFAFLPPGEDPDSLVRAQGRPAMDAVIAGARPLVEVLWEHEAGAAPLDTPERRAGLRVRLDRLAGRITDRGVRDEYRTEIDRHVDRLFGAPRPRATPAGWQSGRKGHVTPAPWRAPIRPETRRSRLASGPRDDMCRREEALVYAVLNHPGLLERHGEQFSALDFATLELDKLRNEIIGIAAHHPDLDRQALRNHLLEKGFSQVLVRLEQRELLGRLDFARTTAAPEEAERGWMQVLNRQCRAALRAELEEAETAFGREETEENWRRILALRAALDTAQGNEADLEN